VTKQVWLLAALLFSTFSSAQIQPVKATIDASKTNAPISKYLYGQFLKHLGGLIVPALALLDLDMAFVARRQPRRARGGHRQRHAPGAVSCSGAGSGSISSSSDD